MDESIYGEGRPDIQVIPITQSKADRLLAGEVLNTTPPKDEATDIPAKATGLIDMLQWEAERIFLLKWHGERSPSGLTLGGEIVASTQHGRVLDATGNLFGTYKRLVDSGGEDGKHQEMIVYLEEELTPEPEFDYLRLLKSKKS